MRRQTSFSRLAPVILIPLLSLVGIGLLLYFLQRAGSMPPAERPILSVPASPPAQQTSVASQSTAPAAMTASSPEAEATSIAPTTSLITQPQQIDASILAVVDGASISIVQLDEAIRIDRAMAQLQNQSPSTPRQLLSQLINGELVSHAMQAAGVQPPPAGDALAKFLTATGIPMLAIDDALKGVTREQFATYLARLYGVDAFVRQQATQEAGNVDAYVRALQEAAHISYGPGAASIFAPTPEPQATEILLPTAVPMTDAPTTPTPITTEERGVQPGQLAPQFKLSTLDSDDAKVSLEDLAGNPVVLSFWTTWCPYCRQQTPVLVDGSARYAQSGVQFIGINVQEDDAPVAAYRAEQQIPYPILLDRDGGVAARYAVSGFPTTYFLDGDGRIRITQIGALTPEQLANNVEQLLNADQ